MADFLEERLLTTILVGAGYQDDYSVGIVQTSGGQEFRSMDHPFPRRKFNVSYMLNTAELSAKLMSMYHRAHGKYAGFRVRCADEWSSNGDRGVPAAFDQPTGLVSAGVYQLRKYYGTDGVAGASGHPYRNIYKPVAGTVKVGIGTTEIRAADWSIVTTTGRVTFAVNNTKTITAITNAAAAVVTVGANTFESGQSVIFSGVLGMTQINGLRALITAIGATTITVAINSTAFGIYTSAGAVNTNPQTGENVRAGFEFDYPARFNSAIPVGQDYTDWRTIDGVELIELLNP